MKRKMFDMRHIRTSKHNHERLEEIIVDEIYPVEKQQLKLIEIKKCKPSLVLVEHL